MTTEEFIAHPYWLSPPTTHASKCILLKTSKCSEIVKQDSYYVIYHTYFHVSKYHHTKNTEDRQFVLEAESKFIPITEVKFNLLTKIL